MKAKNILTLFIGLSLYVTVNAQTTIKRPAIKGIAHFALYASDLDNTRQFYKDYLGYAEPYVLNNKNGEGLAMSFIKINDSQLIELFPEKSADTERFFHFGIETDDAECMRQYLASKGVNVPKTTSKGRIGNYNYFVNDPNGTICEIVQYGEGGITMLNRGKDLPATRVSNHVSHVGFMVPDLDLAMQFYCDILGFKEIWRGSADGKNTTWVHLQVPEGTDCIELMLYNKELSKGQKGVLNHFCLVVDNLPVAMEKYEKRTMPTGCTASEAKVGINRKKQINFFDKDGSRVEIMETHTIDGVPTPSSTVPPLKYVKK